MLRETTLMLACGVIPPSCLFTVEIVKCNEGGNKLNTEGT